MIVQLEKEASTSFPLSSLSYHAVEMEEVIDFLVFRK
jgi:hypothetical protein